MKTPREVLLERHISASTQLNQIRQRVLAAEVGKARAAAGEFQGGVLEQLCQQLFWSCRRAWVALGVAWAVLLLLHAVLAFLPAPRVVRASQSEPSEVETRMGLIQQKQLRAELMGPSWGQTGTSPDTDPDRPRSQLRPVIPAREESNIV